MATEKEILEALKNLIGDKTTKKTTKREGEDDEEYKKRQEEERNKALQEENDLEIRKLKIIRDQQMALGERFKAQQSALELLEKMNALSYESAEALKEAAKNASKAELAEIERKIKLAEYYDKLKKDLEDQTKGVEKLTEAQKAAKNASEGLFGDIALKIGLNTKAGNKFNDMINTLSKDLADNGDMVGQAFLETFSIQKMGYAVLFQVLEATMQLGFAVDKATASFAKQTGAGRALTSEIMAIGGGYRNLGLDAEGAGKAAESLFNNFTGFMQTSSAGRRDLMLTVASMEKLGVSGDVAANSLQLLSNNFGLSTRQASKMTKQLAIAGTKIGISASKMMNGFVEASKSLAVYGKDSIKVFTDLAAQAKAAGVEASALLGIAKQFDTFSGAADAVGKLNSILGTQMSATELLTMKENERIETLIRSVQAQGMAFSDMDKYSQMAIANAAGISDMAEAQRIFGMNVNQYRKGLKESEAEEEFNERLKEAMSVMEKLTKIAQNFAIQIAPLVDVVAGIAQKILDWSQSMNGLPVQIIGIVGGIFLLLKVVPLLFGVLSAAGGVLAGLGGGMAAMSAAAGPLALVIGGLFAAFALGLALLDTEALSALGSVFGGSEVTMTAKAKLLDDGMEFTDALASKEATLKPMLGDLALIATGKTTNLLTTSVASYDLSKFTSSFENTFKPNVTVKIGNEEFKDFVIDTQEQGARE
jgi:hypothetical protein